MFAIKDNPRESKVGWSFLQDERNVHLFDGSTWMMDRITRNSKLMNRFLEYGDDIMWRPRSVNSYLADISSFLETLWALIHITSGQPARATELVQTRYRNTMQGEHRNLYVENGLVAIVTTYHKGYSMEGSTKIIHRYLPKEVSEMLIYYLWLILPFKQFLETPLTATFKAPSPLIWSDCKTGGGGKKKWDGGRVCGILERESSATLKTKLGVRAYRHVAIAMARKHIRKDHFTRVDPEEDDIWDLQAAHQTATAGAIYARELNDAPGVVESQREAFRRISQEWHLFLGFQTWRVELKRPCPFFEGEDEDLSG